MLYLWELAPSIDYSIYKISYRHSIGFKSNNIALMIILESRLFRVYTCRLTRSRKRRPWVWRDRSCCRLWGSKWSPCSSPFPPTASPWETSSQHSCATTGLDYDWTTSPSTPSLNWWTNCLTWLRYGTICQTTSDAWRKHLPNNIRWKTWNHIKATYNIGGLSLCDVWCVIDIVNYVW